MIIEFFGLPGSGKTVNMKELLKHFGRDARQVLPDRKVLRNGGLRLAFSAEFRLFLRLLLDVWRHKAHKTRYDLRTMYHFSLLYLSYMKMREGGDARYYLLDHGLVQSVSSLVWDEPALYSRGITLICVVREFFKGRITFVYTKNDDDGKLLERILSRESDVRLKHFAPEEALGVLKTQRRFFERAAEIMKDGFPVTEIDTDALLACNTELILRELNDQG